MRWVYTGRLPDGQITGTVTAKRKKEAQTVIQEMYKEQGGITDLALIKHQS